MIDARTITALLESASPGPDTEPQIDDFIVAGSAGRGYVARSRTGNPALLVPLERATQAVGRRAAGFVLTPRASVEFQHGSRRWTQPAAIVECTNEDMSSAFAAMIADIANRLPIGSSAVLWPAVLDLVDEWQALLASRGKLSSEAELGLWAELWLIAESEDPEKVASAWRGPDASAFDFLLGGVGVEVKASRQRHTHHFSLSQVERPVGDHEAYVLSMWVSVDPDGGEALSSIVRRTLTKVTDPGSLLRRLARVGYVPSDAAAYATRFFLLELPWWVPAAAVPRVRGVDRGVTNVRYQATLEPRMRVAHDAENVLWARLAHEPIVEVVL